MLTCLRVIVSLALRDIGMAARKDANVADKIAAAKAAREQHRKEREERKAKEVRVLIRVRARVYAL